MYPSYTAATLSRIYALKDRYGTNLKGAVSWAFEFENQPWFYGFRDLATNGVDKPVLNIFRMLGKMSGDRVQTVSSRQYPLQTVIDSSVRGTQTDIGALATKDQRSAAVMVWNYHDNDLQGPAEPVLIQVAHLPARQITLTHYRIDQQHSNAYTAWKEMGSPQQPTPAQIAVLQKAGQLQQIGQPRKLEARSGQLTIHIHIPRQGISLLKMDW